MSKTIISPVKRWPGTVTLADPLTFPQYAAWRNALDEVLLLAPPDPDAEEGAPRSITHFAAAADNAMAELWIPGVCACVEEWNLTGLPKRGQPSGPVTRESFPRAPLLSAVRLLSWLTAEIGVIVGEADELPND